MAQTIRHRGKSLVVSMTPMEGFPDRLDQLCADKKDGQVEQELRGLENDSFFDRKDLRPGDFSTGLTPVSQSITFGDRGQQEQRKQIDSQDGNHRAAGPEYPFPGRNWFKDQEQRFNHVAEGICYRLNPN